MATRPTLTSAKWGVKESEVNDVLIANNQTIESSNKQIKTQDKKGMTLRLSPDAWKQLKIMAVDEGCVAHDLLIEALNDLFVKKGKKPIA
jgi:hypothetical protein